MEINFGSDHRNMIADVLWQIEDFNQAKKLAHNCGVDGIVVLHMIVAASLDDHHEVNLANQVLSMFQRN